MSSPHISFFKLVRFAVKGERMAFRKEQRNGRQNRVLYLSSTTHTGLCDAGGSTLLSDVLSSEMVGEDENAFS
jgi:hypothetical protein